MIMINRNTLIVFYINLQITHFNYKNIEGLNFNDNYTIKDISLLANLKKIKRSYKV